MGSVRRLAMYVAIVVVLATVSTYAAVETFRNLLNISVGGVVNVPSTGLGTEPSFNIKLNITTAEGEEVFNLGQVELPPGPIIVKRELVNFEGSFTLVLSGELFLESSNGSYLIRMPCLLSLGEPCYRVLVLIPGYDAPLDVVGGRYNTTLRLRWLAKGTGSFHLRLTIVHLGTSIEVLGVKPESTDGWVAASGSTRTYSMLVNRVSPERALAYVWVFDPENRTSGKVTFVLVESVYGAPVARAEVQAFREGPYWRVLVGTRLERDLRYNLYAYLEGGVELVAEV